MGTIQEKLDYLAETKSLIGGAIAAKGVEVPEGTPFRDYASKIEEIQSGGGVEIYKGKADVVADGKFQKYSFAIPLSTGKSIIVQVYEDEEPSLDRCVFASSLSDGSLGSSPAYGALTAKISKTENFATVEGYTSYSNVNYYCIVF